MYTCTVLVKESRKVGNAPVDDVSELVPVEEVDGAVVRADSHLQRGLGVGVRAGRGAGAARGTREHLLRGLHRANGHAVQVVRVRLTLNEHTALSHVERCTSERVRCLTSVLYTMYM